MSPDSTELRGAAVGGLFGGVLLGIVLQFSTPVIYTIPKVYLVSTPSLVAGWVGLLFLAVIFGLIYASFVTKYVDQYIDTVLMLTTRSDAAKNLVMPLTNRFGMALVVTMAMGLIYGLVVGIGLGTIVLPSLSQILLFPYVDGTMLAGFALYGLVLGGTYGELVMG